MEGKIEEGDCTHWAIGWSEYLGCPASGRGGQWPTGSSATPAAKWTDRPYAQHRRLYITVTPWLGVGLHAVTERMGGLMGDLGHTPLLLPPWKDYGRCIDMSRLLTSHLTTNIDYTSPLQHIHTLVCATCRLVAHSSERWMQHRPGQDGADPSCPLEL